MDRALRFLSVVLLMVTLVSPARADDVADARTLYDRGMAHFRLEEYPQAIEKWESGFRIRPVPEFLYNIAQAYRLSRQHEKARSFYKKYLVMNPDAPNKVQVQKHIAALDKLIDAEQRTASAPPSEPLPNTVPRSTTPSREPAPVAPPPAAPATEPAPAPAPAAAAAASTPASNNELVASAPAKRDTRPVYKKGWFWGVVGGGVVLVGAAVLIGVLASGSGSSTTTIPAARF